MGNHTDIHTDIHTETYTETRRDTQRQTETASYTHPRAHETKANSVCSLPPEKKKTQWRMQDRYSRLVGHANLNPELFAISYCKGPSNGFDATATT